MYIYMYLTLALPSTLGPYTSSRSPFRFQPHRSVMYAGIMMIGRLHIRCKGSSKAAGRSVKPFVGQVNGADHPLLDRRLHRVWHEKEEPPLKTVCNCPGFDPCAHQNPCVLTTTNSTCGLYLSWNGERGGRGREGRREGGRSMRRAKAG